MPSLQIRDLPDHIYRRLAIKARENRWSLARQAVVELERMAEAEVRSQRLDVISQIRAELEDTGPRETRLDPVAAVSEDRAR
jgi:hypothetical protein